MSKKITIISSENNWLEQSAVHQLDRISDFNGMKRVIGLPDLHPGKTPVGAVFITEDVIYPHIVGSDIGCGMSLFQTGIEARKMKLAKWVKKLEAIESFKTIELPAHFSEMAEDMPFAEHLGTIGGGNHFAELQSVEYIHDEEAFTDSGMDKNMLMLLVHTGSRIFGQEVYDEAIKKHHGQCGLSRKSEAAAVYLASHDKAVEWAALNRELIAHKLMSSLGDDIHVQKLVDLGHNSVETKRIGSKDFFVHRKGAAPADRGLAVIPGSRGTLTYLVMPCNAAIDSGFSIAHGAGRKWERSICKPRLKSLYTRDSIRTTKLKSKVVCHKTELLFEEAPEAYKNIDRVVEALVSAGLARIVATLKPVLTYKN